VSPAGDVIDNVDLAIQGDGANKGSPSIIWDGSDFLLFWEEEPEGKSKIYGASIQSDYRWVFVSESASISTPGKTSNPSSPTVALLGDEALVVWQERSDPDQGWNVFGQIIAKVKTPATGGSNLTRGQ